MNEEIGQIGTMGPMGSCAHGGMPAELADPCLAAMHVISQREMLPETRVLLEMAMEAQRTGEIPELKFLEGCPKDGGSLFVDSLIGEVVSTCGAPGEFEVPEDKRIVNEWPPVDRGVYEVGPIGTMGQIGEGGDR